MKNDRDARRADAAEGAAGSCMDGCMQGFALGGAEDTYGVLLCEESIAETRDDGADL